MAIHLRDRRRQQTEQDLQLATIRLVKNHGYEQVTTSMIAETCGMSVRTFFNYYENKDSALVGPKNMLTPALIKDFLKSEGPLSEDLKAFAAAHLKTIADKKDLMRDIMNIAQEVPRVRLAQTERGEDIRFLLFEAVCHRLGPDQASVAGYVADIGMSLLGQCYRLWLESDVLEMDEVMAVKFDRLNDALTILSTP